MDKANTLQSIIEVTKEHKLKMAKIQATLKGQKVYERAPDLHEVCFFSAWLYDENNRLKSILGSLFFGRLDKLHTEWYTEYTKIYSIFFKDEEPGILSRFLHAPKASDMDIDRAETYYHDLVKISNELLKALGSSQRRIEALSETVFD